MANIDPIEMALSPEQIKMLAGKLEKSGLPLAKLDLRAASAAERAAYIKKLQELIPSSQEQAEKALNKIALYNQEVNAKKKWGAWEYVKSIPRRIWGTMKRHPYMTAAVVVALGAAAAYYTGVGPVVVERLKTWLMSTAIGQKGAELIAKGKDLAGEAVAKGKDLAGDAIGKGKDLLADKLPGVGDAAPAVPPAAPPAAPVPPVVAPPVVPPVSAVPGREAADAILERARQM